MTAPVPPPAAPSRPLRVLYLNPFSQQVSGPDESLLALLTGLVPLGVEPHVVLPGPGPQVERYQALGARVHFAPLTFLKRRMGSLDVLTLPLRLLRGVAAVARIVRRERIELLHTNMEVVLDGCVASRLLRLPHVLHYRGNTLDRPRPVFDVLTRFWTASAHQVLCISGATAEIFRRRGLGTRVEVVYNPIDVQAFASAPRLPALRAALGAGDGDLLVGTVGRIHPRKNIATFLHALAAALPGLPRLRGVVVGTAEAPEELAHRAELEALVTSLGLGDRVCWAGTRRDMPLVFRALDAFVLASRNEGFGRVVAEATAAGLPMVLSREGALPELAEGLPRARLADPESPLAFAEALRELLLRPVPGSAGAGEVARFSIEGIAGRVRALYAAALAAGPGRRGAR